MKVLVAYASKHGSTKRIAEFMCEKLRVHGLDVDVSNVSQVYEPGRYDAFVVGSALYIGQWMKEAKQFVSNNRELLSKRPVWLFSSGPTGTERRNKKGQDLLDPAVSGPVDLPKIERGLLVRNHRIFFGAFDPKNLGFFTRQFFKSATIREASPIGDFRDWKDIESWTDAIGQVLMESAPAQEQ